MIDEKTTTTDEAPKSTHGDETFEWTGDGGDGAGGAAGAPGGTGTGGAGASGREWLAQLQSMIENAATQAAPVMREVAAKAAELAAVAGDKAGPVAARAAELTAEAGHRIAERSRDLAAELRRDASVPGEAAGVEATAPATPAAPATAAAPTGEENPPA
ncbi:MAG TPA: hypothetical protein VLS28_07295 [Candidatus Sulfomarinibacteraceae bacterium]|nr:hypothetical protein [Candidatus Sulfomarinibacteraceae bacterium]